MVAGRISLPDLEESRDWKKQGQTGLDAGLDIKLAEK